MNELIEKLIAAAHRYGWDASLETANAEMDAQIALFAALGRKDEEYRQLRAEVERLCDQWEKLLVEVEDLTSELPEGKDTLDDVVAAVKLMCDQRDYAIEDAALCRAEVARKDKKIAAISYAYNELMNYRGKNTLNFQLEKLDDYLHILAVAIAEARDD